MKQLTIGILTGGGDCPGLNAVIRAVTQTAIRQFDAKVIGIEDGFEGLVEGRTSVLTLGMTEGLLPQGGTILGTSNKGDPWHYRTTLSDGTMKSEDRSADMLKTVNEIGIDVLVTIGGDGTMQLAGQLAAMNIPIIGVPKTIDNDLAATDQTFGFDTAVSIVSDALERLATTASSHHRVMVVEVMGRSAGWIALAGGLAGAADVILLPEIAWTWEAVCQKVLQRHSEGMRYSLVCVAEGALLPDGGIVSQTDARLTDPIHMGGIGHVVAKEIEQRTKLESRVTVLGHLQRGGSPTSYDRLLSTRFGVAAAECAGKHQFGVLVALRNNEIVAVPVEEALGPRKVVPTNHSLIEDGRRLGVCFGD